MKGIVGSLDDAWVFACVVRHQSFTKAAEVLELPKSTVSRRVASLEDQLGVRLLQRTTRKLSLTDVGALYLERVERALSELQEAEHAVQALSHAPRGTLRVTIPTDFALDAFSRLLARFAASYPEVETVVEVTNRRVDLVAEGYDVALRAGSQLADSSLIGRRVGTAAFGLYASPAYLERAGSPATPHVLSAHACLLFRAISPRGRLCLHDPASDTAVEIAVRGPLVCNDLGLLQRATLAGLGIASLPAYACVQDVAEGRLQRVLPRYQSGNGTLYAIYPSPRHLTSKVRAFIDFMSEGLREVIEGAARQSH